MTKLKKLLLVSMVISMCFLMACKNKDVENSDQQDTPSTQNSEMVISDTYTIGEVVDNVYLNSFFGMNIDIPETMYVLPMDEMEKMNQENLESVVDVVLSDEDTSDKTEEELSVMRDDARKKYEDYTSYCLVLYGVEPTPEDSGNIQFVMQTYNTENDISNSAKTASEFLEIVKDNMQIKYGGGEFSDIYTKTIGTKEFQAQDAVNTIGDITITERVFVTELKGYLLAFIVVNNSLAPQEELDSLDLLLNSVNFVN